MSAVETIPAVLRRAAESWPDNVALIGSGEHITYREYSARVDLLSRAVIGSGIELGDRVAIWAPNSVEFAVAAFAVHASGAVVVPINTRFRVVEAEDIIRRSGARGVFAFSDFLGRDYLAELSGSGLLDDLAFAVSLRGTPARPGIDYEEFLARAERVTAQQQRERESSIDGGSLSEIMFTSGTTGRPKGAMLMHGPSVRGFTEYGRSLGITDTDRLIGIPPFFHTFGLKGGVLTAALAGAAIAPVAVFDIHEVARTIAHEEITIIQGAPTVFLDLINNPEIDHTRLGTLRVAAPGASGADASFYQRIRDELGIHQFANGYALTESHAIGTRVYPWDDFETAATSSGRPGPGMEFRIADPDGEALPQGATGEILIRGYNVMKGYLDDPAATAAAIDADGWLHTGDIGFLDEKGRLHVVDRVKDMFLVGGFNTYPAEIEGYLCRHPAVDQVAVIGVPDDRLGEVGKAFVLTRPGQEVTPEEIIEFARSSLANYKVPRYVEIVDSLPRNQSGKILKYELRAHERASVTPGGAAR